MQSAPRSIIGARHARPNPETGCSQGRYGRCQTGAENTSLAEVSIANHALWVVSWARIRKHFSTLSSPGAACSYGYAPSMPLQIGARLKCCVGILLMRASMTFGLVRARGTSGPQLLIRVPIGGRAEPIYHLNPVIKRSRRRAETGRAGDARFAHGPLSFVARRVPRPRVQVGHARINGFGVCCLPSPIGGRSSSLQYSSRNSLSR